MKGGAGETAAGLARRRRDEVFGPAGRVVVMDVVEIGINEIRAAKVCTPEVGPAKVRTAEIRAAEMGTTEACIAEVCIDQVSTTESRDPIRVLSAPLLARRAAPKRRPRHVLAAINHASCCRFERLAICLADHQLTVVPVGLGGRDRSPPPECEPPLGQHGNQQSFPI